MSSTEPTCSSDAPTPNGPAKKSPDDFVFGKIIGEGSFSTVSGRNFVCCGIFVSFLCPY